MPAVPSSPSGFLRSPFGARERWSESLGVSDEPVGTFFSSLMQGTLARVARPRPEGAVRPRAIGPWTIGREVGRGGMGIVYRARYTGTRASQPVAVKIARTDAPDGDALLARESAMLDRFDHAAVVRGYGTGVHTDGRRFLAMELVAGESVTTVAGRLTIAGRLEMFETVCRAVGVVHRAGVVHGDLKPSNVFVTRSGAVKLLDFGIAVVIGTHAVTAHEAGRRRLTPEFAAPEQMLGERVTAATDVYALGLVLHEVLCGRRRRLPWSLSGGRGTVISDIPTGVVDGTWTVEAEPADPAESDPHPSWRGARLDPRICSLLEATLSTDPSGRPRDAVELADAVATLCASLAAEPSPARRAFAP